MSYTEINQEKGMGFGGMPHSALLSKLEETDPDDIVAVRGGERYDDEDDFGDYVRGEIVDWGPDDIIHEEDHARRDPALSRTMVNLRLGGGRGPNDHHLPSHPDLFYGFTGNDPRGADTQPRLDLIARGQNDVRARQAEVRMGVNVGHGEHIEADRPWGGDAFARSQNETKRRLKGYMRWFTAQKTGLAPSRSVVTDGAYGLQREVVVDSGSESFDVEMPAAPAARRVGRAADESAPWRQTVHGADLAVQKYSAALRGGRAAAGVSGGALVATAGGDEQEFGREAEGSTVNRNLLATVMAGAAVRARRGGDTEFAPDAAHFVPGRSAPTQDLAAAAHRGAADQDGTDGVVGQLLGRGLVPSGDRQKSVYRPAPDHLVVARPDVAGAMARRLRGGVDTRAAHAWSGTDGRRPGFSESVAAGGIGPTPGGDYRAVAGLSEMPLSRAAAADGLVVHHYGSFAPVRPADPVGVAAAGGFASASGGFAARREGHSAAPRFRSHTQAPGGLGTPSTGFVSEATRAGGTGGGIGDKKIRSSGLHDGGDDVMREDGLASGHYDSGPPQVGRLVDELGLGGANSVNGLRA